MKILNKILIIPIILGCFIFTITLADDSDCGKFGNRSYKQEGKDNGFENINRSRETGYTFTNFLTIEQQKAIITKDDLNTAVLNLKKYCCINEKGGLNPDRCKNDEAFFNDNSLDSPYLFDHLLDVIMRRLNGLSGENDIYTKTNMTVDDKGAERRQFMNEQATSLEGANPQTIINKHKEFRTQSPSNLGYNISQKINATFDESNQEFLDYVSGKKGKESESIANAMRNYSGWTLYDRYINACALTQYFYTLLNLGVDSNDKLKIINTLSNGSCDKMIEQQIKGESSYVSLIEQRSSDLFSSNYVEGYKSYLYERQQKFEDLLQKSKDRRLDIIRAVPALQRKCTK